MSNLTPLLAACPPRPIAQAGDQYAADIIRGLSEELGTQETTSDFLETTFLTKDTDDFLRMAMDRIALGRQSTSPSVYQLYSRYGGGKTHSLLLLAAAAKYPHLPYWQDVTQCDPVSAKVVAFDGEKHNVVNGTELDEQGNRARSLAGYLLYHLGGVAALHDFGEGDTTLADPGSETFRRLIGDEPVIIVIDELVHYINRVNQRAQADSRISSEGVLTTLSALINAVTNSPRAVLVVTTPEDAHPLLEGSGSTTAGDAHRADALALTDMLERIDSQLARATHPVAPSGEADLPAILRKRLFYSVDETVRHDVSTAYAAVAARNSRTNGLDYQDFHDAYPFHPWLRRIIVEKLSANRNFQRVRGTLRLLGNTLLQMQNSGSQAALAHPHHVTLRAARIRDEVVNRPGFSQLDAAIETDIVGSNNTAEKTGNDLAEPVAVTMLLGTIAPENSNGLYADEIADALLSPEHDDTGVIAGAIEQFLSRAIYVDDSPDTQRKRFSQDANVMKELLEGRDAILSNTNAMSDLLRDAINSAYSGVSQSANQFEVRLFPSRQSNLPDEPNRVVLGIVNPALWNWTDAASPSNGMSNQDLLDLHRHSSGSDGSAPRQYPNNALLLVAHDGNLTRIREDIATMEAADRLLKDTSRDLPQHRRDTLESIRAASEKNATTGIQNKFTHLFSAGNTTQLQWPEHHSHLEVRTLDSITDAVGKGQDTILQALGDRLLRGTNAGLSRNAWANVAIIAREPGSTLGELRDYFARTPDARIVMNTQTWHAMIANGVSNDFLHVRTTSGEENPTGYDASWQVWAKGHEPKPKTGGGGTDDGGTTGGGTQGGTTNGGTQGGTTDGGTEGGGPTKPAPRFSSGSQPGKAAYEAVKQFMNDNGHDWAALASCDVMGTSQRLADQIANIAQGDDGGISITLRAQNGKLQVAILDAVPSEFKDYSTSARRMMTKAGVSTADISVKLKPADAERVLEKLNNLDDANITVLFHQT